MRLRLYLIFGFLRFFAIGAAGFLILFFLAEVLSDLPDALRAHAPFHILPYLRHLPALFVEISPVITFLAALLLVSEMIRGNELRVLEVSGLSPYAVGTTLLGASLAVSLAVLWCADTAVPRFAAGATGSIPSGAIHFSSPSLTLSASRMTPEDELEDLLVCVETGSGQWCARARRARFDGSEWALLEASVWSFNASGDLVEHTTARRARIPIPLTPDLLRDMGRPADHLSAAQIRRLLRRLAALGVAPASLAVAAQERFAYPFLNLFILVAGLPLLFPRHRTVRVVVIGLAVLGSFFSYAVYSFGVALAKGGCLPPTAGVWMFHLLGSLFLTVSVLRDGPFSRIMAQRRR